LADIQNIPLNEKLRDSNPKLNKNFQNINRQLEEHIYSKEAHPAESIVYTGGVPGNNVKQAIDSLDTRIDNIVAQSGDDITEIVDARGAYSVLSARLDDADRKISNAVTKDSLVVNVMDHGAVGDGVTDDSMAIKAAIDAIPSGGTLYFPAGKYLVSSTVEIDVGDPAWVGTNLNITGDGAGSTVIICAVERDYALKISGVHGSGFRLDNILFKGSNLSSNKGVKLSNLSEPYIENVFFNNNFTALEMTDCVRTKLISCTFNQNRNGLIGTDQILESTPNAIDLFGCCFYGNSEMAASFYGGCGINFFGGTVEVSGHLDTGGNRYGVKIENGGRYGGAICNFIGTYFEGNSNIADVWLVNNEYDGTYVFSGCTFNRFTAPNVSEHCIRLDTVESTGRKAKLIVTGCNFEDRGFTTTAATRYIEVFGRTNVEFEQMGNLYQVREGIPEISSNRVFASARFVGLSTTPSLYRGFNIRSISKNGAGDYTVTFKTPSISDPRVKTGSIDGVGFIQLTDLTGTTMRVRVYDVNGTTLKDPTELSLIIME